MHRAILMMLLAVASSNAAAGWIVIGSSEKYIVYVDPATKNKADNMVRMWNMFDYKAGNSFEGKRLLSSTMQYEYDCKEQRERLLFTSARTQNMGKGDAVVTDPFPHEWRPLPPGSIIEALWNYACRKR